MSSMSSRGASPFGDEVEEEEHHAGMLHPSTTCFTKGADAFKFNPEDACFPIYHKMITPASTSSTTSPNYIISGKNKQGDPPGDHLHRAGEILFGRRRMLTFPLGPSSLPGGGTISVYSWQAAPDIRLHFLTVKLNTEEPQATSSGKNLPAVGQEGHPEGHGHPQGHPRRGLKDLSSLFADSTGSALQVSYIRGCSGPLIDVLLEDMRHKTSTNISSGGSCRGSGGSGATSSPSSPDPDSSSRLATTSAPPTTTTSHESSSMNGQGEEKSSSGTAPECTTSSASITAFSRRTSPVDEELQLRRFLLGNRNPWKARGTTTTSQSQHHPISFLPAKFLGLLQNGEVTFCRVVEWVFLQ
ncbi:unnamed protein product [Amoebophrya sp. A25]|nr:unnamed protein product [Amoebophrya sp. A25]|eukprot:GSA25T00019803001.1